MNSHFTRRDFIRTMSAGAAGLGLTAGLVPRAVASGSMGEKPAILGGKPVRTEPFPAWPIVRENDEKGWMEVLHSKRVVPAPATAILRPQFEETWAETLGAKYCVVTSCGTTALYASLNAVGVGPGDEVILPPYTFVATLNVILMQHALPVFVDSDRETFQIDAHKIEAKITSRTRCIMPVHLGGNPVNMDLVLEVAKKHKLPVVEDACQAHTGEWRHRRVSTLGDLGCFSFQASKNLNSGEGGAILTNDPALHEFCEELPGPGPRPGRSRFRVCAAGLQPAHDGIPGRTAVAAIDARGRAIAGARAECPVSHQPVARDSGNLSGPHVRWHHAERLSPLYAPVRSSALRRSAAGALSCRPWRKREYPARAATRR